MTRCMKLCVTSVALLVSLSLSFSLSSSALAADDAERATPETPVTHDFSLTTDPIQPLTGVAVVHGETRLGARRIFPGMPSMDISLGGWIGGGESRRRDGEMIVVWKDCGNALLQCERASTLWAGAQAMIYPVGTFEHGMQLGVEASYLQMWIRTSEGSIGTSVARGLGQPAPADRTSSEGALMGAAVIGYKVATRAGFTFNPQLAGGPVFAEGKVAFAPRLAINVGWSF